jgi:G3E family GTPase
VIISKVDLIDGEKLNKVIEKVREINHKAEIVQSINGKIDYNFLEKNLVAEDWVGTEDTTNTPENKPKTLILTYDGELTKDKLTQFIDTIKDDSYRIKGFFQLEDGWNQVDVVGKRVDYKKTNKAQENSQLVIISKIGPQIIRPIFNAWEEIVGEEMKLR